MLYIPLDSKPPSIEERANIMRRHISKGGVPIDYDRLIEYLAHSKVEQFELGSKLLAGTYSNDAYFSVAAFKKWVTKTGLKIGFNLTPTGNISYDFDSLTSFINTNAYGDEITNVAKLFSVYNYHIAQISLLPGIIEQYKPGGLESEDGRRLILVKPGIATQNTGRFGLVNPALMNLPRYMKDLTVPPKGWTLVTADSGQIEPKLIYGFFMPDPQILKLIEVEQDAYYAILKYCQMPKEWITEKRMDFEKTEITPELKELRQRLKTYGNAVMYGDFSNREKDPLKADYIERIGKHPMRFEWEKKLNARLNSGQRLFDTVFGTPIDVYKSDKVINAKTESERQLKLAHCIINNPIQGTAGDLMGFSLEASDRLIQQKAPSSWITKYVHDEGQYCIHNSELDYVLEEISGHTSYDIGGIVKVYNEPKIGRTMNTEVPCSYEHLFEDNH